MTGIVNKMIGMNELRDWTMWLADWLIVGLIIKSIGFEKKTYEMAVKEYEYDEQKDIEKKQRRTKTTKKTTTDKAGTITTEESTETVEPTGENKDVK